MDERKQTIKYFVLFLSIIIMFALINKILTIKENKQNNTQQIKQNETKPSEEIKKEEIKKDLAIDSSKDLFEVMTYSKLGQMDIIIVGDKKTGLCYLVVKDDNGVSICEYKDHESKQFNIMSYQSYASPYEQNIQNAIVGDK